MRRWSFFHLTLCSIFLSSSSKSGALKHSALERKLIKIRRKKGGRSHSTEFDNEVVDSDLNSVFGKDRQHLVVSDLFLEMRLLLLPTAHLCLGFACAGCRT
jgi:hypothetical protein